jgi:hypothetical protein
MVPSVSFLAGAARSFADEAERVRKGLFDMKLVVPSGVTEGVRDLALGLPDIAAGLRCLAGQCERK